MRAYVHQLYRHLAACDLAVVQGGLTTSMELTANRRPFLYFPLRHHFEQNFHVRHRLARYGAGRCMDFDAETPETIAAAIAETIGQEVDYRPVESDGAARAAALIAPLLEEGKGQAAGAAPAPHEPLHERRALMHDEHDKPASFHGSPQEAMQAPPEEFLYLACLREGTGVEAPDFLAVVDAEEGRIVHELPMPNVGDELHHFGWNRCSLGLPRPRPLAPDRPRLPLLAHPHRQRRRRSAPAADREGDRAGGDRRETGYTRPHTVHCMPGDNIVVSMLGDADGNGAGGFAVLDAKTFEVKGRWENGGEKPPLNYDFWYQPRKNVLVS